MKAVILAGGLGAQLRPVPEAIPKPLLPIQVQAILEIQIERLRTFGATEVQWASFSEWLRHSLIEARL